MSLNLVKMLDVTKSNFIIGSDQGNKAFEKLLSMLGGKGQITEISMEGILGVDACFIRNSIASLTKMFIGDKGFYISNVENNDVLDNLIYGFHAKKVPLILKKADGSGEIYAELSSGAKEVLCYAYKQGHIMTQKLTKHFDISAPNASSKLKKLYKEGYLLSEQQDAATGGIEFVYSPFFLCNDLTYPYRQ